MAAFPQRAVVLLIEQARNNDSRGHRVEHGEDTDTDHELLQRVRLAATLEHRQREPLSTLVC